MASQKFRKYYVRGSTLPFEEDKTHEFKGHLNLCQEEIPPWAQETKRERGSRKPISRNLNAFLNSGLGGTVFLGVIDSGKIFGINMTKLTRDHFLKSVDNLMRRYDPQVLPHQYSVRFTPVVDAKSTQEAIVQLLEHISSEELTDADKERKHIFRTSNYCWCHKDATARYNSGVTSTDFVLEVIIKPWDDHDPRNPSLGEDERVRIQPYYNNEEGKVFFRKQASVVQYTICDLVRMTRDEVQKKYDEEMDRLKQRYEELLRKKALVDGS
ncbi:uncharacterized protein [Littorina saxatilis]|uniref:Schlafen AlbA-2 domain-containing protein n=1 Tax=Littorina saxatilis TaxID=31220 RepID=A0AAN9BU13_9CAEN